MTSRSDRSHRVKADAVRAQRRVLYVAVEGEVTEPDYLDYLNEAFGRELGFRINVVSRRNGLKPLAAVEAVLSRIDDGDEAWVLIDRDQHNDIDQALALARKNGVNVALSHPCFELWLLLHFTAFSGAQGGQASIVVKKLREASSAFAEFGIRGDKSLGPVRFTALRGNEQAATKRAGRLQRDCAHGPCVLPDDHSASCSALARDPSTDVHRLLFALGIVTAVESRDAAETRRHS